MQIKFKLFAIIISLNFLLQINLIAADKELEHPVIKPIQNSSLKSSKEENYSTFEYLVKKDGKTNKIEKGGVYWQLVYQFLDEKGKVVKGMSKAEIIENYRKAALEKGGEILYKSADKLTFSIPRKSGGTSWVSLQTTSYTYTMRIIDEKGFEGVVSFGAEELKLALDSDGRVAIYGINFDINKADLQLGAEKIISEMVKLMKLYPDLKIEIQGHTDNTGSAAHNLKLSNERAETVKKFMLLYGIESSRIVSKGYGMTKPIETNDTEEGRAKNRRVELVKM